MPVTAAVVSLVQGWPETSADRGPTTARGSSATRTGVRGQEARTIRAPASSVITATAPAATASGANSAP